MEKVALILVTFNRLEILKINLEYIRKQSKLPDHVLIVENGSSDGTIDFLENQKEFNYLLLNENIGWSGGLDAGMTYSKKHWNPDFYWLMDDDSFPSKNVLSTLLKKLTDQKEPGIMGLIGCNFRFGIPYVPEPSNEVREVEFVLVDNALISKEVVDVIGNLNPDYFIMAEDYEYCRRVKKFGFKVFLWRDEEKLVDRLHLGSIAESDSIIWRGYYHSRNHILILKEYFEWNRLFGYLYRHSKILIHALLFSKKRWRITRYRLMGIMDGIKGVRGKTIDPITLQKTVPKKA